MLQYFYLFFHYFVLISFLISVILGIQVFPFSMMSYRLMVIELLILELLLKEIVERMLLRDIRKCKGVFIGPLRVVFKPIQAVDFLEIKLIAHSIIYTNLYQFILFQSLQGHQGWGWTMIKLFDILHKLYYFGMETNKRKTQNEANIIEHIKFIAKDLFVPESPQKYNNFNAHYKEVRGEASRQFVRTLKQEGKYREIKAFYSTQGGATMPVTFSRSKSKTKKKPIFGDFNEFWSNCTKQVAPTKEFTPIMERINKNVYNKFKKESRVATEANQTILNSSQREQLWSQFLKRQQDWDKSRKQLLRESKLRAISRQSPQLKRRTHTNTNVNDEEIKADKEMTEVQKGILRLRDQTQRLKLKLQKINRAEERHRRGSKRACSIND